MHVGLVRSDLPAWVWLRHDLAISTDADGVDRIQQEIPTQRCWLQQGIATEPTLPSNAIAEYSSGWSDNFKQAANQRTYKRKDEYTKAARNHLGAMNTPITCRFGVSGLPQRH